MNKVKLGDVMDVKRGTSLSGEHYSTSGDLVRLTLGNFKYPDCGFKLNTAKKDIYFVGEVKPEYIMKKGDIITPLTEQVKGLLGNTATIPESDKYIQSGDVGKIIPNESMIDKRFSYYLVASPTVKKQLSAGSQQTKIRHTSPDKIKDCVAFIPDLFQQKKIAHLLDTINLLIQTNNSAIKQLESMAKTIYDYWFLQFEFPNEGGKPYKSSGGKMVWNEELKREIPVGWTVSKLDKCVETIIDRRGVTPKKLGGDWVDEGIIALSAKVVKNGRLLNLSSANKVSEEMYDKWMPTKLINGDILMTSEAPLGEFYYLHNEPKYCLSQRLFAIRAKKQLSSLYLYYELSKGNGFSQIKGSSSGSTVFGIRQDELRQIQILVPNEKVMQSFQSDAIKFISLQHSLDRQNQELASLRDFLFPMLMNGQVTFKD